MSGNTQAACADAPRKITVVLPSHWMAYIQANSEEDKCPRGFAVKALFGRLDWYQREILFSRWVRRRNARFLCRALSGNMAEKDFQKLRRRNENNRKLAVIVLLVEGFVFLGAIGELINVDDWDRGKFPICCCVLPAWIVFVCVYSFVRDVRAPGWLVRREELRLFFALLGNWSNLLRRARNWIEKKA